MKLLPNKYGGETVQPVLSGPKRMHGLCARTTTMTRGRCLGTSNRTIGRATANRKRHIPEDQKPNWKEEEKQWHHWCTIRQAAISLGISEDDTEKEQTGVGTT